MANTKQEMMRALAELKRDFAEKLARQNGVPTYFDNWIRRALRALFDEGESPLDERLAGDLARYAALKASPRFARYDQRNLESAAWCELPWEMSFAQYSATQGVEECLSWRGLPLFKSVFDFALYPLLIWDLRPATIIELGAGTGASALWFADLLRLYEIAGHVYSFDISPPAIASPAITLIAGDAAEIQLAFERPMLAQLRHPWLIVEDMHVNTLDVLRHFARELRPGDYFVVEDSHAKRGELAQFQREHGDMLRVDRRYTDLFGRNATCSADSILVCT